MKQTVVGTSLALAIALGGGAYWLNAQSVAEQSKVAASAQQSSASNEIDKDNPKVVNWEDLLPEGELMALPQDAASDFFGTDPNPFSSSETGNSPSPMMSVPVPTAEPRQDLANTFVKIAGYMTPFNVEAGKTRTFLLVPYVGACIHVPAPPANQIVLVETSEPVEIKEMWEPFEAVGTLRVETISTELAEVAYTMDLDRIEPFVFEDEADEAPLTD
ncbi:DUF3299 domain-containing protein [Pseudahrensia aquimaris]|uniref:DUF3299 domain-containing protein n=1 Tax=Pseudahrensia aquimaris TaxID=744461 RepID=A0ABW3FEI7_9HYPH